MTSSPFYDPYLRVLKALNQAGVRYVVVGMSGINYYAADPRETFSTMDYDIFLDPTKVNIEKTLAVLSKQKYTLSTSKGLLDPKNLDQLIEDRNTLIATDSFGIMIEFLLQISGYPFSEIFRDAETFRVGNVPIKVGRLNKLIQSKKIADRPKDRLFLKRYQKMLKEKKEI